MLKYNEAYKISELLLEELLVKEEGVYLVKIPKLKDFNNIENDIHAESDKDVWYPALLTWAGDVKHLDVMGWNWSHNCLSECTGYLITDYKKIDCETGYVKAI